MPKPASKSVAAPAAIVASEEAAPDPFADAATAVAAERPPVNGRGAPAPRAEVANLPALRAQAQAPEAGALPLAELLVRLLELEGPRFGPRSSLRRLLAVAIGREMELAPQQLDALALAALLGGLGDLAAPGEESDGGRRQAVSMQLLATVPLPAEARDALAHQYERWDGAGLPDGLREERIPFAARILAVARAAADLLAGRAVDPSAAVDELQRQAGSAFDPVVVSVLRRVFAQRERHGIGYGWGGRVAVAHPRELRALDLAARLHAGGYAAETAADAAGLRDRLREGAPRALVLGAELPGVDTAALVREVRSAPALAGLPVVVVDAPSPETRVALLSAGADVCFPPDAGYAEVKATLDALLRRTDAVLPREAAQAGA